MIKQIARLEAVVGSRVGHFLLENDTPVSLAIEMCTQFLTYLKNLEEQAKAQQEAAKTAETPATTSEEAKPQG